jgi:antitoxin VapB
MGLNIKNQRVHDLARRAAEVTGKTQTSAIEEALERLLLFYGADPAATRRAHKVDIAYGIAMEYQADPGDPDREIRTVEDLYDEATGLPR